MQWDRTVFSFFIIILKKILYSLFSLLFLTFKSSVGTPPDGYCSLELTLMS